MSYSLKVVADSPKGLWILDNGLQDHSGKSVPATVGGAATPTYIASIVASCSKTPVLDATHRIKVPMRLYKKGYEATPFTLEAWVYMLSDNASVMSRTLQQDGLAVVNGEVVFSLRFSGGTRTIAYKPDSKKVMHVVGSYTKQSMALYVNGELFQTINFTDAQQTETFVVPDEEFLVTGELGPVAVQALAVYEYQLSENKIRLHYKWGRDAVDPDHVPSMFGGTNIDISDERSEVFLHEHIGPQMSWTLGDMDTLAVDSEGGLVQQWGGESYSAGTWKYAFDTSFSSEIHGVRIGWEGEGNFIVRTSLDQENWTIAENNKLVSTIVPGASPQFLFVSIEFAENDNARVATLELMGFQTNELVAPNRTATLSDEVTIREEWTPLENRLDYGLALSGGSIALSSPVSGFNTQDHTWEIWYYGDTEPVIDSPGAVVKYHNGTPYTGLSLGSWNLLHLVSNGTNPITGLTISGNVIVGRLASYPTALTASQASDVYKMYTGKITSRVNNSGSVSLTQGSVKIYAFDWSIVGAN